VARRRTGRKRGRPRHANAKRRATTRAGRKTGHDPVDRGAPLLRQKKLQLFGRDDIEMTGSGTLLARGLIDRYQFDYLGLLTFWLARLARNLGPKPVAVGTLWQVLVNGMISPTLTIPVSVGDDANKALTRLDRMIRQLDGSRELVLQLAEGRTPPLIAHVLEGRITGADERALDRLRQGLDAIGGRRQRNG
jgi:hypothetical protein